MLGLDVGQCEDGTPIAPCPEPCRLDEIAAITFTDKAAGELKQKLRAGIEASEKSDELRWELDNASVGTIHAFCTRLLREHALRLGIDPSFRVLDERETTLRRHEIIRGVVMSAISAGGEDVARLLAQFSLYDSQHRKGLVSVTDTVLRDFRWHKDRFAAWTRLRVSADEPAALDIDRILELSISTADQPPGSDETDEDDLRTTGALYSLAFRALSEWLSWMEKENVRDFDSLILDVRRLLTRPQHRAALKSIRRSLKILIIDEFQDTDEAQQDIAFALAGIGEPEGDHRPQLLLVGDPKQSIYRFRGADVGVWNRVRDVLCGDEGPMRLTVNFRTRPGVVGFINDVCSAALEAASADLRPTAPELRITYSPLVPSRESGPGEGIDWLDCSIEGGKSGDVHALEARLVVSRIRRLLADGRVADADTGIERAVQPRDIAVLARTRAGLDLVDRGLRAAEIPAFNAASLGLSDRPEVIDLVTVLRLFRNPEDDYHGFAFLRSPFVGLRDETIARFRLDPDSVKESLIKQAARFLRRADAGETTWFGEPANENVAAIEREALRRALSALEFGQALVERVAPAELLESVVRQTGYRLHLLLRPAADEAIASIERFSALLDEYRRLTLADFLSVWDLWGEHKLGIPHAPLFSAADDVVTLQTIHTAKGLEWPIVFLVRAEAVGKKSLAGTYVSHPGLGPILMSAAKHRGPRAEAIASREDAASQAEEARLLYVALTRARDRLVVAGPGAESGYMRYLGPHLADATPPHLVSEDRQIPQAERRDSEKATADDPATRTGGQIEVFDHDSKGQMDIFFHSPRPGGAEPVTSSDKPALTPVVHRTVDPVQGSLAAARVSLSWLDDVEPGDMPPLARAVPAPPMSRLTSATELSAQARDLESWRLLYVHGVQESRHFVPPDEGGGSVPAPVRGTLIHGVLERIEAMAELTDILSETIAGIDAPPGVEDHLLPGTDYREALEAEIARVVTGDDWRWYVEGEHYRELRFLHLTAAGTWTQGAIDLYRPGTGQDAEAGSPWVIDFKTHRIEAADVEEVAADYGIQIGIYRDAVTALAGTTPRALLHFTHPNVATEV